MQMLDGNHHSRHLQQVQPATVANSKEDIINEDGIFFKMSLIIYYLVIVSISKE